MILTYSQNITKAEFVAEMQAHRAADHFISGNYFDVRTGKGCAVGCGVETINKRLGLNLAHDSHADLANALGWPVWLCGMEDRIFEGLPPLERSAWPVDLATAVPEGADLEPALNRILARTLMEVVLPVAGSSVAIVQRVADGCATNWANDDPKEAQQAAAAASCFHWRQAAAADAADYAASFATASFAADYAASFAAASFAAAADEAASFADVRQNALPAIAQIVLEEVAKIKKPTATAA
jgi:hypothetical protein